MAKRKGSTPRIDFDDIIGSIYEAALDPALWTQAFAKICESVSGSRGVVAMMQLSPEEGLHTGYRADPDEVREYRERHYKTDLWVSAAVSQPRAAGSVFTGEMLVERRVIERSEHFSEYMRRWDIGALCGSRLHKEGAANIPDTGMLIYRALDQPLFDETDVRTLERLTPALRRATALYWKLRERQSLGVASIAALELLSIAVALIARNGDVVYLNRRAESLIAKRDGLALRGRRLAAATAQVTDQLQRRIALAATGPEATEGALALPRQSHLRPLVAMVLPLPANLVLNIGGQSPAAAMFISDPEDHPLSAQQVLAAHYGLTPAESAILSALVEGESPEDIAVRHSVKISTVRTQIRRVFDKTGVTRVPELMALYFRSAMSIRPYPQNSRGNPEHPA